MRTATSLLILPALLACGFTVSFARADATPAIRTFLFSYSGAVTGIARGERVRVWLPIPPSNDDQRAEIVRQDLPAAPQVNEEPRSHNRVMFLEAHARRDGSIPFAIAYRIIRHEVSEENATDGDARRFLAPDALVPVGGKPARVLLAERTIPADQLRAARVLYDIVDDHMQYRKDKPGWGRGDANWACESGFGNCTDFHSLFISLARTNHIPAKFEIGFSIPIKRGSGDVSGYHCWAKFKPAGRGWVPVDISEANKDPSKRDYYFGHLCENRVAFSTGRDLVLVPKQAGPPINFFIYPYAELGGKPVPAERIKCHFTYADEPAPAAKDGR